MLYSALLLFAGALLKTGNSAVALFTESNSGIIGNVTVTDRWISLWLDLSHVNVSKLPGGLSCLTDGLHYHIHDKWTHTNGNDYIGATACGSGYTGGHYDPYLACSAHTANKYCKTYSGTYSCVDSSHTSNSHDIYECNQTIYDTDPYSCEVGDWSGKYGKLIIDDDNITYADVGSFWEVQSTDLTGKSIVFHCANTDARAFCAPFLNTTDDTGNLDIHQDSTTSIGDSDIVAALIAYPYTFNGVTHEILGAYIGFTNNGTVIGGFSNLFSISSVTGCTSYKYRIYDSWYYNNGSSIVGSSACYTNIGEFYDPTVTCMSNTDAPYCWNNELCNDTSYSYSCNYTSDRYSCAPGDLSGKYGAANLNSSAYYFVSFTTTDDLILPLDDIANQKSVVIECAATGEILACGEFEIYSLESFLDYTIFNTSIPYTTNSPSPVPTLAPTIQITLTSSPTKSSLSSEGNFHQLSLLTFGVIALMWSRLI